SDYYTIKGVAQAFRIDIPGLDKPLIGEYDLIVQDGRDACIVDWKTSASRWPAGKADRDLQATVFSYAYEKQNGTTPLFRFDVITKTKNPGCESHYTSRGFHDFRRFEVLANRAQYAINKGVFLPNETSFACSECPYRDRCGQWHLKRWR
ncbi:PD-(D/E)XK nuclease family protein, partial [Victivallis vadensis]